jgi:hypothetical protein
MSSRNPWSVAATTTAGRGMTGGVVSSSAAAGKVITKLVPSPAPALVTSTVPPCISTR